MEPVTPAPNDSNPRRKIYSINPGDFDTVVGNVVPGYGPTLRQHFQNKGITLVQWREPKPEDNMSLTELWQNSSEDIEELKEKRKFLLDKVLKKEKEVEQAERHLEVLMQFRNRLLSEKAYRDRLIKENGNNVNAFQNMETLALANSLQATYTPNKNQ